MQNHQADSPLYVWPHVWSADLHLFIKNMVIHDIECPYWDQMSLKQHKQKTAQHAGIFPMLYTGFCNVAAKRSKKFIILFIVYIFIGFGVSGW